MRDTLRYILCYLFHFSMMVSSVKIIIHYRIMEERNLYMQMKDVFKSIEIQLCHGNKKLYLFSFSFHTQLMNPTLKQNLKALLRLN